MTKMTPALPKWATLDADAKPRPVVTVDAEAMYPAILAELLEHYGGDGKVWWTTDTGKAVAALADLGPDPKKVSAYWLEVAYQAMKMDLQIALRSFNFTIFVQGGKAIWALKNHPPGRGQKTVKAAIDRASGGRIAGGKEARKHYERVRGVMPATQ